MDTNQQNVQGVLSTVLLRLVLFQTMKHASSNVLPKDHYERHVKHGLNCIHRGLHIIPKEKFDNNSYYNIHKLSRFEDYGPNQS